MLGFCEPQEFHNRNSASNASPSPTRAIVMPLWPTSWLIHQFLPSRFALVAPLISKHRLDLPVSVDVATRTWEVWFGSGRDRMMRPWRGRMCRRCEELIKRNDFWSRCGVCFCVMLGFQELNPPDIPWYSCVRVGGLKRGNISGGPEVEPYPKQVGTAGLSDFHSLHGQTLDILCCLASIWN